MPPAFTVANLSRVATDLFSHWIFIAYLSRFKRLCMFTGGRVTFIVTVVHSPAFVIKDAIPSPSIFACLSSLLTVRPMLTERTREVSS